MNYIDDIVAELTVDYKDRSILEVDSPELRFVDYFFSSITCNDKGIEKLLYEVIGSCLVKTAVLSRAFILKGSGRNSKSKIFRIVESLLKDKSNCSHEHLEDLSGSKAGSKSTVKYLNHTTVNLAEDQKPIKYINNSLLSRLISGEPIVVEHKGELTSFIKPYATLLFSVNEVIDFKETGRNILDRFVVIPFNAVFTDENNNRDIHIESKLCNRKSLQIIATRALQAFNEVLQRGKYTMPDAVIEETRRYFMECNNVAKFCTELPIIDLVTKNGYFKEYCKWCELNNFDPVSDSIFGKKVLAFGYRSERYLFGGKKNGNRNTYYVSSSLNSSDARAIYNEYIESIGISDETANVYSESDLMKVFNAPSFSEFLCKRLNTKTDDVNNN